VEPRTPHRPVGDLVVEIDFAGIDFTMTEVGIRLGVGTRVMYDGAMHVVTEWLPTPHGTDVVLRGPASVCRISLVELLTGARYRLIDDNRGPASVEHVDPAAVVLGSLSDRKRAEVTERAAHMRESSRAFVPAAARSQYRGSLKRSSIQVRRSLTATA
jgi:hypothetical protein